MMNESQKETDIYSRHGVCFNIQVLSKEYCEYWVIYFLLPHFYSTVYLGGLSFYWVIIFKEEHLRKGFGVGVQQVVQAVGSCSFSDESSSEVWHIILKYTLNVPVSRDGDKYLDDVVSDSRHVHELFLNREEVDQSDFCPLLDTLFYREEARTWPLTQLQTNKHGVSHHWPRLKVIWVKRWNESCVMRRRWTSRLCVSSCVGLLPWVKLVETFEAQYSYVTNEGTVFTFRTNLDAPRYRVINIDLQKPERENWSTLIPQHHKDVLGNFSHAHTQR